MTTKIVSCAVCWLACIVVLCAEGVSAESGEPLIVTNSAVQTEIQRIVDSYDPDDPHADSDQVCDGFIAFGGLAKEELLLQALLSWRGKGDSLIKRVLIGKLAESFSPESLMEFALPLLKETHNQQLKMNLMRLLDLVAFKQGVRPDFSPFEKHLKQKDDAQLVAILTYMYRVDPHEASLLLARLHQDEEGTRALLNDAGLHRMTATTVSTHSKRGKWWRDLYVLGQLRRSPNSQKGFDIRVLQNRTNTVVQQVASGLEVSINDSSTRENERRK